MPGRANSQPAASCLPAHFEDAPATAYWVAVRHGRQGSLREQPATQRGPQPQNHSPELRHKDAPRSTIGGNQTRCTVHPTSGWRQEVCLRSNHVRGCRLRHSGAAGARPKGRVGVAPSRTIRQRGSRRAAGSHHKKYSTTLILVLSHHKCEPLRLRTKGADYVLDGRLTAVRNLARRQRRTVLEANGPQHRELLLASPNMMRDIDKRDQLRVIPGVIDSATGAIQCTQRRAQE